MNKILILIIMVLSLCSCTANQKPQQKFMDNNQIINKIADETKVNKENIIGRYIWAQYVDIDEDPELELLLSYRFELHKGYFFIFDYLNGEYHKVFNKPWAIEKMSAREIVNAEGNDKIHTLTINLIEMQKGEVRVLWSEIADKYDYSKIISGTEVHGQYYIDTNGILNYFYKIDQTDKNGIPIKTEFKSERLIWDKNKNKFVTI